MSKELVLVLPSSFVLACYRFELEPLEAFDVRRGIGNALRGGLGYTFKRLACAEPWLCDDRCVRPDRSPYGYIFETAPPEGSEVLRKNQAVPRPFVIEPPRTTVNASSEGTGVSFNILLVGRAIQYATHFVWVFKELGRIGLGSQRGKYRLRRVDTFHPFLGHVQRVYDERSPDTIHQVQLAVSAAEVETQAARLPYEELGLEFVTATRLIFCGKPVRQPPFHLVVRRLLDRVSSLSYFHCGERWETGFKEIVAHAEDVQLVESNTEWVTKSRFSGRQRQQVPLSGFTGTAAYQGDLAPYRALLLLGSLVHIGKATVFGNGKYLIGNS